MKTKMNSCGKTWHTWNTGHHGHPADALPLGSPALAWSFSRDGEARPQSGVDDLKGKFARPVSDIRGVTDRAAAARTAPPR